MNKINHWNQPANKKSVVPLFLFVLFIPFTYNILEYIFYMAQYLNLTILKYPVDYIADYFENNFIFWDAMFCFFALLIFSVYYGYIWDKERRDRKYSQMPRKNLEPMSVSLVLRSIIIMFGMAGIAHLWLIFVQTLSEQIDLLFLGESLNNFAERWSDAGELKIWYYLSIVVFGPIVEELVFRGIQFHYAEKIKSGLLPIFITGLTFGIWHQEPVQVVYTFFMGIALGIVYHYSRSMILVTVMHIINNFLSQIASDIDNAIFGGIIDWIFLLSVIPAIFFLVKMMIRINKSIERPQSHPMQTGQAGVL